MSLPTLRLFSSFVLVLAVFSFRRLAAEEFPKPYNTQPETPLTAAEALTKITLPEGFKASLFAAEPDVEQPIGMTLDARGRLWVVENYTYAEAKVYFAADLRDRILILEDTNGAGHFDKRTVFWSSGRRTTSVAPGFGGAFVLDAPNLLYIPDRNGDDVPDGEPVVLLNGFNDDKVRHNIVNGLLWGPDGWLYGRHGIQDTSYVGPPGAPPEKRTPLNCGIWRYHPVTHQFEVVCNGTTNPWGLDYDQHGQMFFSNTVIGHFWHVVPGAFYQRMYGEHFRPNLYQLIGQCADHFHFDTGKGWTASRVVDEQIDKLGGGHAHVGLMIYQGDNWPEKYRSQAFMCNLHGRRVNVERIEPAGCSYVAKHEPDFLRSGDLWFRGIDLLSGPDGGVYLSDWSDTGECHESDGVHRSSGRIYKITYGDAKNTGPKDLSALSDAELVALLLHKNDWFARIARRLLQERASSGHDMKATHEALQKIYYENADLTIKLRALWALYATGGADRQWLQGQLAHPEEHIRVWAVRLLTDDVRELADSQGRPTELARTLATAFARLAKEETSGLVRLYVASALQRLPLSVRSDIATRLIARADDANDPVQPLMIWYGIEPLVAADGKKAIALATKGKMPLIRQFITRRLASELEKNTAAIDELLQYASGNSADSLSILQGLADGLQGVRQAQAPAGWAALEKKLGKNSDAKLGGLVRQIAVVFGDGRAIDDLRKLVADGKADSDVRHAALTALLNKHPPEFFAVLKSQVNDRALGVAAIRGLATYDDPSIPEFLVNHYGGLSAEAKAAAVATLAARPAGAKALLSAVAAKQIARAEISAAEARQIQSLGDTALSAQLTDLWGELRTTPAEKLKQIAALKKTLSESALAAANPANGRALFMKTCANCHKLYGEGAMVGPDLTGSNRHNLDYLLENLVDPSALVPADFRMSIFQLESGRVLNGIIIDRSDKTYTIQTPTERLMLEKKEIATTKNTPLSLMPEGQLSTLSAEQVRDLVAYLMTQQQVELPASGK